MTHDVLVKESLRHSDMTESGLQFLAESFDIAHVLSPGGLSIEIGSRCGGSALLQLRILEQIYPERTRPYLFTVDPYGMKPYNGGDNKAGEIFMLYGDKEYVSMKQLLAGYYNHVHWYLESLCFLPIASIIRYWGGSSCLAVKNVTFALLDGDHDARTIEHEVKLLFPLMSPTGTILIDNLDKDPQTLDRLASFTDAMTMGPRVAKGAMQARISMEKLHV